MKDYWSYLQNPVFDSRFIKAVEIIGTFKDKVIFDMNCGTSIILKYLSGDFAKYIGNDYNEDLLGVGRSRIPDEVDKVKFICCKDDEILKHLPPKIDIFLNFGICAGVNKGIESETELDTFKRVIQKFLPEIVVCEGWSYYEEKYKIITQREEFLKPLNYVEIGSFFMTEVMFRTLKVYRRK